MPSVKTPDKFVYLMTWNELPVKIKCAENKDTYSFKSKCNARHFYFAKMSAKEDSEFTV